MITLSILDLKTRQVKIECYYSKDKAEKCLGTLKTLTSDKLTLKKGRFLDGWSYDTSSEKALIEQFLPEDRRITGKDSNG